MAHIEKKTLINAPIDKVYAFARDPQKWNTWWIGLSAPDEINGKGEVGTMVKHRFMVAGLPFAVTTKVLIDRVGPKDALWKGQIEGPLAGQHEWKYNALGEKTEVFVKLDYTVPGKIIGKFADHTLIEKMQEKALENTLDNLKLLCEANVEIPVLV
jgi:coenzyme Q-binding protein COQ10